jgi:hypothetical protein
LTVFLSTRFTVEVDASTVEATTGRVLEKTAAAQSATLGDSGYDVAAMNWPGDIPVNSLKSAFMCDWS